MSQKPPTVDTVPIRLGRRDWRLKFDFNAICEVEQLLQSEFGAIVSSMTAGRLAPIRALLWAGLIHQAPDLKPHLVGSFIEDLPGDGISEKIGPVLIKITEAVAKSSIATKKIREAAEEDLPDENPSEAPTDGNA